MKKTLITMLSILLAANAGAQTVSDALRYSKNDYIGSARSLALGNAVTALGGDLGSVTINPAGSAVANYSQATFSPGFAISSNKAGYAVIAITDPYSNTKKDTYSRLSVPNFGFNINFDTGYTSGITNISFGMSANQTNNYIKDMHAGGINDRTSFLAAQAYNASGINFNELADPNAFFNGPSWDNIIAYNSGMIANYDNGNDQYIGATERIIDNGDGSHTIELAGAVDQRYKEKAYGNKYDVVFNSGMNINSILYLGLNVGFTSLDYNYDKYYNEYAVNPENFPIEFNNSNGGSTITNFDMARYKYSYDATGNGIYAKLGFIAAPFKGLRFGAAIQTPTTLHIDERYMSSGDTYYTDKNFDAWADSPRGDFSYKLKTPYRVNAGLAYTFKNYALISVDYEYCDYSTMKFKNKSGQMGFNFDNVNDEINSYSGGQHMLRIGTEVKPIPCFSMRAGWNLTTSPEYYYLDGKKKHSDAKQSAYSFGIGYSSNSSFYTDLGVRCLQRFKEYIAPYDNYIFDNNGNVEVQTPEIYNKARVWDIVWTIGFRF